MLKNRRGGSWRQFPTCSPPIRATDPHAAQSGGGRAADKRSGEGTRERIHTTDSMSSPHVAPKSHLAQKKPQIESALSAVLRHSERTQIKRMKKYENRFKRTTYIIPFFQMNVKNKCSVFPYFSPFSKSPVRAIFFKSGATATHHGGGADEESTGADEMTTGERTTAAPEEPPPTPDGGAQPPRRARRERHSRISAQTTSGGILSLRGQLLTPPPISAEISAF